MIVGVDGGALFPLDSASPHPASDALAEGARFTIGIASVPVEDRNPVGVDIRTLVEIVDRSHRCPCWWSAPTRTMTSASLWKDRAFPKRRGFRDGQRPAPLTQSPRRAEPRVPGCGPRTPE